jgi:K+-transporting ATPase c subunit
MNKQIRANFLLLVLTVLVCCVLYPLVLYGVGQVFMPGRADGSLVSGKGPDGKEVVVGSRLIASPFGIDAEKGAAYFHPRPSAAGYNGAASGGSNLGGSSPKLRQRVAKQPGPIVRYRKDGPRKGALVGPDIEAWAKQQPESVRASVGELPAEPSPDELRAAFFDLWLQAHPDADFEPVPADMVTASGSGLDPHITLRNALSIYQLDRVAAARARDAGEFERVRGRIAELTRSTSFTPLAGLAGEPLVNVLELNLALDREFPRPGALSWVP